MGRSLRAVLVTFVVMTVLSLASTAVAAVVPWQIVDISVQPAETGRILLVSCELPETATLPAQVEISVPASSAVLWLGETDGQPTQTDPQLKFTKRTVKGADVYTVTLTKYRMAQLYAQGPEFPSDGGSGFSPSVSWVAAQDIPEIYLGVLLPGNAQITREASGAVLETMDAEHQYYGNYYKNVKPGQKFDLAFSYTVRATTVPVGGSSGSGSNVLLIAILGLVLVAGIAVIALAVKMRTSSDVSADDDDDDDDDEPVERVRAASALPQSRAAAAPVAGSGPSAAPGGGSGKAKRNLITGGVLVLFVLAAAVVGVMVIQPKVVGDTISQTFNGGNPCTSFTVQVAPAQGADPSATANTIFAALKPLGIIDAEYNIKTNELVVGYCQDAQSEANILAALAPTGLVSPSAETTTP